MEKEILIEGFIPDEDVVVATEETKHYEGEMEEIIYENN